ncbi:MAG: hypothetical protein HZB16_00830 [Armatimonadetes bacterium]|nr:hypothetical protein [Armatimonadota bacterium]
MDAIRPLLILLCLCTLGRAQEAPRVESVLAADSQPAATDPATIWYESFEQPDLRARCFEYSDNNGGCVPATDSALTGKSSLRITWQPGQVEAGGVKVVFGLNPWGRGPRHDEAFNEIWWRQYVRHEPGWRGNPAKLSRALCMAGRDWSQGLMAHVWGGRGDCLCLDPASGITDSTKRSTRYNDFANLRWLGVGQGATPFFATAESGRWWCVEAHVRLNTPGGRDGLFELWLDGKPQARREGLDFHGTWREYALNAVFFENYWNDGSPRLQRRWFDDLVVANAPIGPITARWPLQVTLTADPGGPWELRLTADAAGERPVLTATSRGGRALALPPGTPAPAAGVYWCQTRLSGGAWSPTMAPFRLAAP